MTLEDSVLRPLDPDLESDDWPEFELRDARVYDPSDPETLVSLLEAAEFNPLTVTGALQPKFDHSADRLYRGKVRRSGQLEIPIVRSFAYGELEDGGIALWAAGKAGWFAITPHADYVAIYEEMSDAVRVLYFIVDAYGGYSSDGRKASSAKTKLSLDSLFEKFAEAHSVDANTAMEMIYRHRRFLLSTMLTGKEDIVWTKTKLYQHFCGKFPSDVASVKRTLSAPVLSRQTPIEISSREASVMSTTSKRKRAADSESVKSSGGHASTKKGSEHVVEGQSFSRLERYQSRSLITEKQSGPDHAPRNAKFSTPVLSGASIIDEDEPRKGRKRKSALRLRPLMSVKGTPKANQSSRLFVSDDDSDSAASPREVSGDEDAESDNLVLDAAAKDVQREYLFEDKGEVLEPLLHVSGAAEEMSLRRLENMDPVQEDTWNCPRDGCMHKVYLASREDSQELIKEHCELHTFDDDARVQLVKRLQAPSLPVNHLMERVRLQARADQSPSTREERPLPSQPVVQRY